MPWGKHRGESLDEIELSYLGFLFEKCDLTPTMRMAISDEILRRCVGDEPTNGDVNNVQTVFRKLAMKYHPDKGGSNDAIRAIYEFKDLLTKK